MKFALGRIYRGNMRFPRTVGLIGFHFLRACCMVWLRSLFWLSGRPFLGISYWPFRKHLDELAPIFGHLGTVASRDILPQNYPNAL